MALDFRRGDASRPRGHALAYFESGVSVLATYLVIPPIVIDLAKYMPPMFAGQLPTVSTAEVSAMPLPPIPEEIEGGLPALERLAELRDDDLIYCGSVQGGNVERMLYAATDAGQRYGALYRDAMAAAPQVPEQPSELAVEDVMLSLMGDHDRVGELAKMMGRLRYALDGADATLASDTVAEMERVGRHLPDKYRVPELIAAAQRRGQEGARLAELHVERCYKLALEQYADLSRIEAEIKSLS